MTDVTIDIRGELVPAVLELPASGSGPAVIVVQEWWGIVPHIRDIVRRLADEGFVALAVDHYRGDYTTKPDRAQKMMMALSLEQVAKDLAVAAEWLAARDEVEGESVRVVGFCMGGALALLGPAVSTRITLAVGFYPALAWPDYGPDWSKYEGKRALIHKAEEDEPYAGPKIAEYAAAILTAGGTVDVVQYPASVHAFFNDDRPEVYQPENAAKAWAMTLDALRSA